ncbi:MAG: hypothetical protein U9R74_14685 [Pseudomonadota bacterium]|nr:hypothetical protein [Pseudomonadota bacterium]
MIQLRNVPDGLHRKLKARAALEGMSLSDYLIAEIGLIAERPTLSELRRRLQRRGAVALSEPPADAVRAERDRR